MEKPVHPTLQILLPGVQGIPKDFFDKVEKGQKCAQYLLSCAYGEKMLYVSPSFEELTGYAPQQLLLGGTGFWFPLIHPADLPLLTRQIAEAHQKLALPDFNRSQPGALVLEYRLKKADGSWIWVEESKWIVEFTPEGIKDKILVLITDVTEKKLAAERILEQLLEKERGSHTLLEVALQYQRNNRNPLVHPTTTVSAAVANKLTKREKEVLGLIASGLSTKVIADKLCISDNTVETHRRHLLEKFGVKNSAELVQQASQLSTLPGSFK